MEGLLVINTVVAVRVVPSLRYNSYHHNSAFT